MLLCTKLYFKVSHAPERGREHHNSKEIEMANYVSKEVAYTRQIIGQGVIDAVENKMYDHIPDSFKLAVQNMQGKMDDPVEDFDRQLDNEKAKIDPALYETFPKLDELAEEIAERAVDILLHVPYEHVSAFKSLWIAGYDADSEMSLNGEIEPLAYRILSLWQIENEYPDVFDSESTGGAYEGISDQLIDLAWRGEDIQASVSELSDYFEYEMAGDENEPTHMLLFTVLARADIAQLFTDFSIHYDKLKDDLKQWKEDIRKAREEIKVVLDQIEIPEGAGEEELYSFIDGKIDDLLSQFEDPDLVREVVADKLMEIQDVYLKQNVEDVKSGKYTDQKDMEKNMPLFRKNNPDGSYQMLNAPDDYMFWSMFVADLNEIIYGDDEGDDDWEDEEEGEAEGPINMKVISFPTERPVE